MRRRLLALPLLALCVAACGGGASSTPTPLLSGVDVYTVAGPSCPVQASGQSCAARPIAATVVVTQGGATRATVTTASNGRGHVPLPPGVYTLSGRTSARGLPRPPAPQQVSVPAGQFVAVQLSFDTGIR